MLVMINSSAYSQTTTNSINQQRVTQKINEAIFQLFPTQNMWTFIKLDTRNGRMWQVQYHTDEKLRFESNLNILSLVPTDKEENGRFTLYATQNIYSFLLLDQIDGKTWQV